MNRAHITALQEAVGTEADGFWGPKSIAACQQHLLSLMPEPNPWPAPSQHALTDFFGDPYDNSEIVPIDAPTWMRLYDTDTQVQKIFCHVMVADSLIDALEDAYDSAPRFVSRFFGCHVDRNIRGGTKPSTHAYGAAIDLAASTNGNHTHWPLQADMPLSVMEAFARRGWTPAGAFWSRDAMHFQAARPYS